MSKIVIADSSCLIGMSKIGKLDVLRELFGEILVPEAVYHEVVIKGAGKPGADAVKAAEWIIRLAVRDELAVKTLRVNQLGQGECEAMVLALEQQADFLILDDGNARKAALALELPVIGTVAILHKAEQKGLLADFSGTLEQLKRAGFRFAYFEGECRLQDAGAGIGLLSDVFFSS
jgi:predicted nucleic acid-binding protein